MAIEYPYWDMEESYVGPMKELMATFKPKNILEVGLGQWGFSTRVWLEHTDAKVTSVDKGDWKGIGEEYTKQYPKRFLFLKGMTEDILPTLKPVYDFIFIDGDHSYEGCKQDILNCQKLLAPKGLILLDDYGVHHISAVNVDGNGNPIDDYFGVMQAVDECFKDWKRAYMNIQFGNGGVAFRK